MRSVVDALSESIHQTLDVTAARVLVESYGRAAIRAWTLRSHAAYAPLWRLRYRWSLRRRAPAWKQRMARGPINPHSIERAEIEIPGPHGVRLLSMAHPHA